LNEFGKPKAENTPKSREMKFKSSVVSAMYGGVLQMILWHRYELSICILNLGSHVSVFARSNAGFVGSNPTQGIYVFIVCIYSVFVLFCV
jgi:hypothetical protein